MNNWLRKISVTSIKKGDLQTPAGDDFVAFQEGFCEKFKNMVSDGEVFAKNKVGLPPKHEFCESYRVCGFDGCENRANSRSKYCKEAECKSKRKAIVSKRFRENNPDKMETIRHTRRIKDKTKVALKKAKEKVLANMS